MGKKELSLEELKEQVRQKEEEQQEGNIMTLILDVVLEAGVKRNTFTQDLEINGETFMQKHRSDIMFELAATGYKGVTKEKVTDVLSSSKIPEFNPVTEFNQRNKKLDPLQCEREFVKWVSCIRSSTGFEISDEDDPHFDPQYILEFMERWYVGMVAQAIGTENEQIRNEWFLALVGEIQGSGKTRFLELYTLPEEFRKRNLVMKTPVDSSKEFKSFMKGAVLIFDDELDGKAFDKSFKTFKALMSMNRMPIQRKYENETTHYYRRATLAGTGNNVSIIKERQNRRIIGVNVEGVDLVKLQTVNRDMVWMHAWHKLQEVPEFQWWFTEEIRDRLQTHSSDFTVIDRLEEIVKEYFEPASETGGIWVPFNSIAEWIEANFRGVRAYNRLGGLLKDRGCEPKRRKKERVRGYIIGADSEALVYGDPFLQT